MKTVRRLRRKESERTKKLYKIYDRKHARMRVLCRGIGEELKTSYDASDIRVLVDILVNDLMPAVAEEEMAFKRYEDSRDNKKNPRTLAIRRNPKR